MQQGLRLLQLNDAPSERSPAESIRRFGDYELLEEIARGGMGIVYRARQIRLNRIVAVKMLLFGEFSSDEFVRRFKSEAALAAVLQHPNIVAVHEIGEENGQHYFSMEYVAGRNLADAVRERPLPPREAAAHLQVLANAVHYAHQRGVLHRDLKPSNVLIDDFGRLHLTDFGLAKRFTKGSTISISGQMIGSPNYMPPEQASPDRGPVSPASDVYALGAILFHLLTGRPPVIADSLENTVLSVLHDEPIAPRLLNAAVPRDLETICLKCLQKNPLRRYSTARALADDLERFLRREPILARTAARPEKLWRWCRKKPLAAAAIVLLGIVSCVSGMAARHLSHLHSIARRDTYLTEINRAQQEWQQQHFSEAFFYLQRQIPSLRGAELRGFEWRHLWTLARGNCSSRLPVHSDVVSWLSFSPDSGSIATFGWDRTNGVQVWDRKAQKTIWSIPEATSVGGFSADGKLLVAGLSGRSIALFNARNGLLLNSLPATGDIVAFAPQVSHVVTMDSGRLLKVQDAQTAATLLALTNASRRFFDGGRNAPVAISPDGRWLAIIRAGDTSEPRDRGVEVWSIAAATRMKFLGRARQIRALQFSPDSTSLAIGDGEGEVMLWNWGMDGTRTIKAHPLPVHAMAFSSDGNVLATGSSDERIKLWDLQTLQERSTPLSGQKGVVWSLAFAPQGTVLASGSRDMPVNLWDLSVARAPAALTNLNSEKFANFAFSPDSKLIAGGCKDHCVRIWSVDSLNEQHSLRGSDYVVAFGRDNKRLLIANASGSAFWWTFATGERQPVPAYNKLGEITAVELSPDRRIALVGHKQGAIQLLEIESGKILGTYQGHRDAVLCLTFAPDAHCFASGSRDKEIRLWTIGATNQSYQVCAEHKGAVVGLAISSDGKTMASGCSANTIKFWDLSRPGQSLGARSWHRASIRALALSPDGQRVASGSEDHSVKLWDFATRRELASYEFNAAVRGTLFSPDGDHLAVVTDNGALHLLSAVDLPDADREIRAIYAGH